MKILFSFKKKVYVTITIMNFTFYFRKIPWGSFGKQKMQAQGEWWENTQLCL